MTAPSAQPTADRILAEHLEALALAVVARRDARPTDRHLQADVVCIDAVRQRRFPFVKVCGCGWISAPQASETAAWEATCEQLVLDRFMQLRAVQCGESVIHGLQSRRTAVVAKLQTVSEEGSETPDGGRA